MDDTNTIRTLTKEKEEEARKIAEEIIVRIQRHADPSVGISALIMALIQAACTVSRGKDDSSQDVLAGFLVAIIANSTGEIQKFEDKYDIDRSEYTH